MPAGKGTGFDLQSLCIRRSEGREWRKRRTAVARKKYEFSGPLLAVERKSSFGAATSGFDPNVWSGRALQEVFVELAVSGLASMYPVSDWSCFAPDHHGYQRACVLISGQTSAGHSGHQCSHAPVRPVLHPYLSLSQTSAGKGYQSGYVIADSSSFSCSAIKQVGRWRSTSPRSPDHGPGLTKRCGPACWPAQSAAHCGAVAFWRLQSRT
jgi:hypothetical protein